MFTGLVSDVGDVLSQDSVSGGVRVRIACGYDASTIADGASIACAGICLTAVGTGAQDGRTWFDVDVSPETLDRTMAGHWRPGHRLNLERSLKIGDELGGHIVTGHVDAITAIVERRSAGDYVAFALALPPSVSPFVAEKGSVALDGTSLTVNAVSADLFEVMIIPHTLAATTWGDRQVGDQVNIEVDLMARYAARLVSAGSAAVK